MIALRGWWSQPTDYNWNVTYAQSHPILRHSRLAIGLCCWAYGIICVLALASPIVTWSSTPFVIIALFTVSTSVVGYAWIRGPWPAYRRSVLFIAYAELGVSSVLLSLGDPTIALLCAALLGVMGNYVAAFHNAKLFVAHQAWALATCAFLYARAVAQSDTRSCRQLPTSSFSFSYWCPHLFSHRRI